jgi:hypothetical protein
LLFGTCCNTAQPLIDQTAQRPKPPTTTTTPATNTKCPPKSTLFGFHRTTISHRNILKPIEYYIFQTFYLFSRTSKDYLYYLSRALNKSPTRVWWGAVFMGRSGPRQTRYGSSKTGMKIKRACFGKGCPWMLEGARPPRLRKKVPGPKGCARPRLINVLEYFVTGQIIPRHGKLCFTLRVSK